MPNVFKCETEHVLKIVMQQATSLDNYCFTHVPNIKRVPWPDEIFKMFMANFK